MSGKVPTLLGLGVAALVLAAAAFLFANALRPAPTLEGMDALLDARRFDEAERRLEEFLRAQPDSAQAHMLMAQVALAREDQKPRQALEHLKRVRVVDKSQRAVVRLNEGKAYSALRDYVRAESAWKSALELDPLVPEAGWALLGLYYVEGRRRDAEQLGLALHASEPDPRDRVQLLLELLRQDAQPIIAFTIINTFEPAVLEHPEDLHATLALGRAEVGEDHFDRGLDILRRAVDRHPGAREAWDALLAGLERATRPEELARTVERLPTSISGDPRFLRYLGMVAQDRRDWARAEDLLLRAREHDPADTQVLYRLFRVLHLRGRGAEARRLEQQFRDAQSAQLELLPLYHQVKGDTTLGMGPNPELYRRIALLRERTGRLEEALAWHRLILRDDPGDAESRAAIDRLSTRSAVRVKLDPPPAAGTR
ncbi:MAG: tetratricopeptide repeat protein [Isosphaeraceae bacterium]